MAFGEGVDEGNAGFEGHDGGELGLVGGEWGEAVEHEAGADEVGGGAVKVEEAGGIAEVDVEGGGSGCGEGAGEGIEEVELGAGEGGVFIGDGKVGSEAGEDEVGGVLDLGEGLGELVREESAASHSGVEGEVGSERAVLKSGERVEVGDFVEGAKAGSPLVGDDFFAFVGKGGTEEVGSGADARLVKATGFANVGDTKEGEVFGIEGAGDFDESVAVGITFDHGHDFFLGLLTSEGEVAPKGGMVDFGPGTWWGGGHGREGSGFF